MRILTLTLAVFGFLIALTTFALDRHESFAVQTGTFSVAPGTFTVARGIFTVTPGTFTVPRGTFLPSGGFVPTPGTFTPRAGEFIVPRGQFAPAVDFRSQPGAYSISTGFLASADRTGTPSALGREVGGSNGVMAFRDGPIDTPTTGQIPAGVLDHRGAGLLLHGQNLGPSFQGEE